MKKFIIVSLFLFSSFLFSEEEDMGLKPVYFHFGFGLHFLETNDEKVKAYDTLYDGNLPVYFTLGLFTHIPGNIPYLSDSFLFGASLSNILYLYSDDKDKPESEKKEGKSLGFYTFGFKAMLFLDYVNAGPFIVGEIGKNITSIGIGYASPQKFTIGKSAGMFILSYVKQYDSDNKDIYFKGITISVSFNL